MKTAIPGTTKDAQNPTSSSRTPLPSPHSGYLAQLAAMMNQSPQVQAQFKLRDEIQNSERVQRQIALAAEINHTQPSVAQLRLREEEEPAQREAVPAPNRTGLPDQLKSGVESLSGISLDDVKVHYNSAKPAQLNALAYAQGTDIHVAAGQEKHLPHEAWHIVQQKQGRVRPTIQMKPGVPINDDPVLEREADVMGWTARNADQRTAQRAESGNVTGAPIFFGGADVIQGVFEDSEELRKKTFIAKALQYGILRPQAIELYSKSGSSDPDPVTGLKTSTDKEETQALAREYAGQDAHGDKVFYAKIKLHNLAGLNAAKGHAGADDIFRLMAESVEGQLNNLRDRYQVQGYRHEGSRFGFIIVGDKNTLTQEVIERELTEAQRDWNARKAERGLADIANPKRPHQPGVDLGFFISEMKAGGGRREVAASDDSEGVQEPPEQGIAPEASQGAPPGIFKGQAQTREETFYATATRLGLNGDQARELYGIAGRSEKEALTGFDAAGDRVGTMMNAMRFFQERYPDVFACYVEVDVRNLGGLNDNLTRGDSDNVFRFMADTTDKHMRSLPADVVSFRHGGDEFSFVAVGHFPDVKITGVWAVLEAAEHAIDGYVQTKKIWQKERKGFPVDARDGSEVKQLNRHELPGVFRESFEREKILRSNPVIETNTEGELWSVIGSETYWLISYEDDGKFRMINIPRQLTLNEILHSKNTPENPRRPGTGIVWGASRVFRKDTSPIDAIARADQSVERKKGIGG